MLAALTDDIINLVMSLDVVHFKTMLDKSRATSQEQEEELRKRQITIAELETKVCTELNCIENGLHRNMTHFDINYRIFLAAICDGS